MSIRVVLPYDLKEKIKGDFEKIIQDGCIEAEGSSLEEVIDYLDAHHTGFRSYILAEDKIPNFTFIFSKKKCRIRSFYSVFINGEKVNNSEAINIPINDGAVVSIAENFEGG